MASVQFNEQQLADVRDLLSQIMGGAEKAQVLAINRASASTQSRVVKAVAAHITPTQKAISKSMTIRKAKTSSVTGALTITGSPIPLYQFDWSYIGPVFPNKRRNISVRVRRDKPREIWRHVFLLHVYGGTKSGAQPTEEDLSGHVGFFQRVHYGPGSGKLGRSHGRLPIKEVYGPSVPSVFLFAPGIEADALAYAGERLAIELGYAANYLIKQQLTSLPNE